MVQVTAQGDGPVNAMDQALRLALGDIYPDVKRLRLTDFKVRDLDSQDGTAARVRVLIETTNGESSWGTVGVHQNIIEASWQALAEGITIGLLRRGWRTGPSTGDQSWIVTVSSMCSPARSASCLPV